MLGCYWVRGSLAANAYGELTGAEHERLSRHLARCPKCRERAAAFQSLAGAPTTRAHSPGFDLLPMVRRRLKESPPWAPAPTTAPLPLRQLSVFAAAAALALGVFGIAASGLLTLPDTDPADGAVAHHPSESTEHQGALAEAAALMADHDYAGAFRTLQHYLGESAEDERAGQARLTLADLAYEELQWFDRAHNAYELVVRNHRDLLEEQGRMAEVVLRWNVLAEARKVDYASVNALFAALDSGRDSFEELQAVVARYPGTFVASQAVQEMAGVAQAAPGGAIEALAAARERATDPVVQAQVDLELGFAYLNTSKDAAKAREHFVAASECSSTEVVERARASLASLQEFAEP